MIVTDLAWPPLITFDSTDASVNVASSSTVISTLSLASKALSLSSWNSILFPATVIASILVTTPFTVALNCCAVGFTAGAEFVSSNASENVAVNLAPVVPTVAFVSNFNAVNTGACYLALGTRLRRL